MDGKPERVREAALRQLGAPYVYGAWGDPCTPQERRKRWRMHPNYTTILSKCQVLRSKDPKPDCAGCAWEGRQCFDCRGLTDWCLKQAGIDLYGDGCTTQYNTASNWDERGPIADMPDAVCCVFIAKDSKKSHTGLHIGGWETVECSTGVQRKALDSRWTHYAIPKGLYTPEELDALRARKPKKILRTGSRGDAVKVLQERLSALGYGCGAADGVFGRRTRAAVRAFQRDHSLAADGIFGPLTRAALEACQTEEKGGRRSS